MLSKKVVMVPKKGLAGQTQAQNQTKETHIQQLLKSKQQHKKQNKGAQVKGYFLKKI